MKAVAIMARGRTQEAFLSSSERWHEESAPTSVMTGEEMPTRHARPMEPQPALS